MPKAQVYDQPDIRDSKQRQHKCVDIHCLDLITGALLPPGLPVTGTSWDFSLEIPAKTGLCSIHPGTFAPIPQEAVATMFPILPSAGDRIRAVTQPSSPAFPQQGHRFTRSARKA